MRRPEIRAVACSALVCLPLWTAGCAGGSGQDEWQGEPRASASSSDDLLAELRPILEEQGFDTEDLELVETPVIRNDEPPGGLSVAIGGDMLVDVETVRAWDDPGTQKGYFHWENAPAVTDACVQLVPGWLAPDGDELPFMWAWAFLLATQQWDAFTDVNVRWAPLNDPTCDQVIYLGYGDIRRSDGTLHLTALGQGKLPTGNGLPGNTVVINRNYQSIDCQGGTGDANSLPWEDMMRTALHELGHNFGFRHPQDALNWFFAPDHIPGTATVSAANPVAYPSVMHSGGCVGDWGGNLVWGANVVDTLSADDIASANAKF